jgi:hypothetical protein
MEEKYRLRDERREAADRKFRQGLTVSGDAGSGDVDGYDLLMAAETAKQTDKNPESPPPSKRAKKKVVKF